MTGLPKNLFNKIKSMIFQYTTSQRSDIAALQGNVTTLQTEWTTTTVDIPVGVAGVSGILGMGTNPIELLPAPGAGKYYEYDGELEYTFNGVALAFAGSDFIGITSDYSAGAGSYAGAWFNNDYSRSGAFGFSSKSPYIPKAALEPLVQGPAKLNEPLTFTTWNGTDPNANDGTIKIKIKYKVVTFG